MDGADLSAASPSHLQFKDWSADGHCSMPLEDVGDHTKHLLTNGHLKGVIIPRTLGGERAGDLWMVVLTKHYFGTF